MAEETEKQEGQKTVVAFIAGLLIGGLLVWVFSSSPEGTPASVTDGADDETSQERDTGAADNTTGATRTNDNVTREVPETSTQTATRETPEPQSGNGAIAVSNQGAGTLVTLSNIEFPSDAGWVVVRDYADAVPGKILGAARYNVTDGLLPQSVNLLRSTEAGSEYQVVFYSENGDRVFDLSDDTIVEGIAAMFTAQ